MKLKCSLTALLSRICGEDQSELNIHGTVSEMMKKTLLKAKWKVSLKFFSENSSQSKVEGKFKVFQ